MYFRGAALLVFGNLIPAYNTVTAKAPEDASKAVTNLVTNVNSGVNSLLLASLMLSVLAQFIVV